MNIQEVVQTLAHDPEAAQRGSEKLNQILSRSATDSAFRQKLLTDPRAAIAEFAGKPVADLPIVFVENTADATFVLPDAIDPAMQLSEEELQAVAGGSSPGCIATALMCAVYLDRILND
jgi:hypothetical protein